MYVVLPTAEACFARRQWPSYLRRWPDRSCQNDQCNELVLTASDVRKDQIEVLMLSQVRSRREEGIDGMSTGVT